jgi:ATP-dependent protease ClpP protease subunit
MIMGSNRARAANAMAAMSWQVWSAAPGHITVRGLIDAGVERAARDQIARAWDSEAVEVAIQSPGGDVRSAYRICNDLAGIRKPITATVYGLCGSAATSILALAGKRVGRPADELVFHRAVRDIAETRGVCSADLRKMADQLDDLDHRYRAELVGLGLSQPIIKAATSSAGWTIDGRSAFAHRILTDLKAGP